MASLLSLLASIPYFPNPHFMALAPLDVWARLLFFPPAKIPVRYWPRLLFALATSALATALTLPERLLLALWFHWKSRSSRQIGSPLFVLGYYRSGTTHLQNLLNLDPGLFSPKWVHTLAPQGFIFSWTFLRYFLIPFLPATRRIDALDINPDLPSEDDFALNNWALASALPAWLLPRARQHFERFHDLRTLTLGEQDRWCHYQLAFLRKLSFICGGRRLLLKSPVHTARVEIFLQMFPEAKFVHISREPREVVRSNIRLVMMMQQLFGFQAPPPQQKTEEEIVHRYSATEQRYLEARHKIPKGQLAEVRLQDLLADPLGEIKRLYGELDLRFTEAFERQMLAYLRNQTGYAPNIHPTWTEDQERRLAPSISGLVESFHQDRPATPAVALPKPHPGTDRIGRRKRKLAVLAGLATAIASATAWLLIVHLTANRHTWIVWPVGIAIGCSILRVARCGSWRLGLWSLLLTLLVFCADLLFSLRTIQFATYAHVPLAALSHGAIESIKLDARLFWFLMGLMTAYRLGSRPFS